MRSLAILLFVAGTLPMAFVEPFIGLLLWVLFSYMNPYREAYGFAYNFRWVLIIAGVTVISMIIKQVSLKSIPWTPLTILLFLFLVQTGITTLNAVVPSYAVPHWILFLKIEILLFAVLMLVTDKQRMNWLIWTIVVSFGFWGVKGGIFTVAHGGYYHVLGPTGSFYRDNNQFALVMCMTIPLIRYLQLQMNSAWVKRLLGMAMVFTAISVLGTYSRGGLITLAIVLFLLLLKSRRRVSLLLFTFVFIPVAFSMLPHQWKARMETLQSGKAEKSSSFQGRLHSWEFATNVALHRPLIGGGYGVWLDQNLWYRYGIDYHRKAIHSIWFQVLGEQGFVGLIIFVTLLVMGFRNLSVARSFSKDNIKIAWINDLSGMMQVSLFAFVVAGSALPQAYFDFTYQLLAMTILVRKFAEEFSRMPKKNTSTMLPAALLGEQ